MKWWYLKYKTETSTNINLTHWAGYGGIWHKLYLKLWCYGLKYRAWQGKKILIMDWVLPLKKHTLFCYITIIRALPINHAAVIFSIKVSKIANPSYLLLKFNTMKWTFYNNLLCPPAGTNDNSNASYLHSKWSLAEYWIIKKMISTHGNTTQHVSLIEMLYSKM